MLKGDLLRSHCIPLVAIVTVSGHDMKRGLGGLGFRGGFPPNAFSDIFSVLEGRSGV